MHWVKEMPLSSLNGLEILEVVEGELFRYFKECTTQIFVLVGKIQNGKVPRDIRRI